MYHFVYKKITEKPYSIRHIAHMRFAYDHSTKNDFYDLSLSLGMFLFIVLIFYLNLKSPLQHVYIQHIIRFDSL